ncbi:hypothetical protein [Streptomyces sp. CMB-StM0423]|uniref:hypothetical protein n=1 Tax=Streptomyces sp. CMB-StM0423 TaxID=2059884 RepID=UPI001F40242F|nr:hypothetical protein [Streptomyces sp. CMB-StM0423]
MAAGCTAAYVLLGYAYGPILAVFMIAVHTLARHVPPATAGPYALAALLALLPHLLVRDHGPGLPGALPVSAWAVVPFAPGYAMRLRRPRLTAFVALVPGPLQVVPAIRARRRVPDRLDPDRGAGPPGAGGGGRRRRRTRRAVEAAGGMAAGTRDLTPEQPRDVLTTTPTTLAARAYAHLRPPLSEAPRAAAARGGDGAAGAAA